MDRLVDKRGAPVFIHSELDDLGLSARAFRVYCHLARRAGGGAAWPSYQKIGDKCFSADSGNPATRRSWAIRATNELVAHGLVDKELRQDENNPGRNKSNTYTLTPQSAWVKRASDGGSLGSDGGSPSDSDGGSLYGDGGSPKGIPIEDNPLEGIPAPLPATPPPAAQAGDGDADTNTMFDLFGR